MPKDSAKSKKHDANPNVAPPVAALRSKNSPAIDPAAIIEKLSQAAQEALNQDKARILDFAVSGLEGISPAPVDQETGGQAQADNPTGAADTFSPENSGPDMAAQQNSGQQSSDRKDASQPAPASKDETLNHPDSGIEILVKMAERGEIDPKNVDIIDVCDKFLRAIAATPKESLRLSGKVIFHAAVLLRLKAEALLSEANNVINPVVDDFLDFDADGGPIIYDSNKQEVGRQLTFKDLEGAIVRRAQRKPATRERRVTLDQLIAALKEAEKLEAVRHEKKPKAPRIDLSGYNEVNDVDDILDLAHDEDIEGTIVRVEQWLAANLSLGESVELFQLVKKVNKKQDWVEAFLAALFLSNAGKIDLAQDTFYGPLYLSLCQQILDSVSDNVAKSG